MEAATRSGCTDFNKIEFLHAIDSIRANTFKKSTILSSWRKSGLIPFNPEIVLQKIRPIALEEAHRAVTPPPLSTSTPLKTPTTVRSTRQWAAVLTFNALLDEPIKNEDVIRFARSAIINASLRQEAEKELLELQAATTARLARQKSGKKTVQKGDIMYAKNARNAVDKRAEKEKEAKKRAAARQIRATATAETKALSQAAEGQTL